MWKRLFSSLMLGVMACVMWVPSTLALPTFTEPDLMVWNLDPYIEPDPYNNPYEGDLVVDFFLGNISTEPVPIGTDVTSSIYLNGVELDSFVYPYNHPAFRPNQSDHVILSYSVNDLINNGVIILDQDNEISVYVDSTDEVVEHTELNNVRMQSRFVAYPYLDVYENTDFLDADYLTPTGVLGQRDALLGSFVVEAGALSSDTTHISIVDHFEASELSGNIQADEDLALGSGQVIDGLLLDQVRNIKVGDELRVSENSDPNNYVDFEVNDIQENGSDSSIEGTVTQQVGDLIEDNELVSLSDVTTDSMADLFQNLKLLDSATGVQLGAAQGSLTDVAGTEYVFGVSPLVTLAPEEEWVVDIYAELKSNVSLFNYNLIEGGMFQPNSVTAHASGLYDVSWNEGGVELQDTHFASRGELEILADSNPESQQFQYGDTAVELARFVFEAWDIEDVNVEEVVLANMAESVNVSTFILEDLDTGDVIGTIANLDSIYFDEAVDLNGNWVIPAGESRTLSVKGNISDTGGQEVLHDSRDISLAIIDEDGEGANQTIARGEDSNVLLEERYTTTSTSTEFDAHYAYRTTLEGYTNSATPTGAQVVGSDTQLLSFDLVAGDNRDATFRQGEELVACVSFTGGTSINVAHGDTSATEVQGSACEATDMASQGDGVAFDTVGTGVVGDHSHVSFWIQFHDEDGGGETPDFGDLGFFTAGSAMTKVNSVELTPAHFNAGSEQSMKSDVWYQVIVALPSEAHSNDQFLGVELLNNSNGIEDVDDFIIDEFTLFSDSITVHLDASDFIIDESSSSAPISASLKSGTTVLGDGFVSIQSDLDALDNNASAKVVFFPVDQVDGTDRSEFTVSDNGRNFYVNADTIDLLELTAGDDFLTPRIELGAGSIDGSGDGDIRWYEDAISGENIAASIGWVMNEFADSIQPFSPLVY